MTSVEDNEYLLAKGTTGSMIVSATDLFWLFSKHVKPMHISGLTLKLKLRLRALFRRAKRRSKPCPVSLLTLPKELIQEVSYFVSSFISPPACHLIKLLQLSGHDQKALRSTCHHADNVLRSTVLSALVVNIFLPLTNLDQDLLEYLASGPAGYVHRLRICIWSSYSEQRALPDCGVVEGGHFKAKPRSRHPRLQTKVNTEAFRALYNTVLASLTNLQIFTLCTSNGSRKAPPFFFEDTLNWLMKRPILELHLTHPEFTIPYFSHLSRFRNIRSGSVGPKHHRPSSLRYRACFPYQIDRKYSASSSLVAGRQYHRSPSYFPSPTRPQVTPDIQHRSLPFLGRLLDGARSTGDTHTLHYPEDPQCAFRSY
ncbi:uncharacterized protein BT62DRAFT_485188 [Guyanagaster necrorhizus]|uniref:Uncharacterized protein n=1 Tax=Guyanagaster necrorhizus TaxID=856835 RepID=A0A9P7VIX1_9AGAR|nr:uncharacterized protein BT62DRAFT_485188 [Guyanagaster necrorhizus MCA 3950]KAG7441370.1 hypothetical protein BT62DRAFT_485188 [Guyanagaster necrorhizus MCA 3950]